MHYFEMKKIIKFAGEEAFPRLLSQWKGNREVILALSALNPHSFVTNQTVCIGQLTDGLGLTCCYIW